MASQIKSIEDYELVLDEPKSSKTDKLMTAAESMTAECSSLIAKLLVKYRPEKKLNRRFLQDTGGNNRLYF